MGGPGSWDWAEALGASFEAAVARDEEVAAADLAFSLRQDVDLRAAVVRSGGGWVLAGAGAAAVAVDEVGVDYVRAGTLVVPASRTVMRSARLRPPSGADATAGELLGRACRAGAEVTIGTASGEISGTLRRVGKDHVAVRSGAVETVVGLGALEWIRLPGYSASRGFSG